MGNSYVYLSTFTAGKIVTNAEKLSLKWQKKLQSLIQLSLKVEFFNEQNFLQLKGYFQLPKLWEILVLESLNLGNFCC